MAVLCCRCIRAIGSRGEKMYVGQLVPDEEFKSCMWCEETENELYYVEFERSQYADIEIETDFCEVICKCR